MKESQSCIVNLPVESSQTSSCGSDGASGSVISVEEVVVIVVAVTVVVIAVVGSENATGNNGTGGKGSEPEDVQIDVENQSSPVVEGTGSARVSADEPDRNNQSAKTLRKKIS